ncbi:hypothetical protein I79_005256 [Cricetulus griseus]|uniref:Uncharacterized protein n=1 Tax=Cricetulus griseus TaxID=10029 RepID=G3H4Q0_CRIGR|nr:hypothetical protein I79_005256 [Cricetulus griseus]
MLQGELPTEASGPLRLPHGLKGGPRPHPATRGSRDYTALRITRFSPTLLAAGCAPVGQSLALHLLALGLLGQQHGLDVGQDAALRDGHPAQQLVEFLVVADGQLQVARDDARLLVVAGRVASQLQDLGRQVLQHGRQVHRGAGAHPLRVVALAEQAVHTAHGELQAGPGGAGRGRGARRAPRWRAAQSKAQIPSPNLHSPQAFSVLLELAAGKGRTLAVIPSPG